MKPKVWRYIPCSSKIVVSQIWKTCPFYFASFWFVVVPNYAQAENYALSFDGVNDHCIIQSDSSLNLTNRITMEAWIKWGGSNVEKSFQIILNQDFIVYEISIGDESGYGHFLWFLDKVNLSAPDAYSGWRSGGNVELDEWNHIAITYDGSRTKSYLNGELTGDYPASGSMPARNNEVHIGARSGPQDIPGSFFAGLVDEVRIWGTARTQEQIKESMHRGLVGDEEGLVGYWNFDEGEGQTASDRSPFGNHAGLGNNQDVDESDPQWVETDLVIEKPIPNFALHFDGVDDHCEVSRDPSLNITDKITLEAAINWAGPTGEIGTQIILNQDFIVYEMGIGDIRDEGHFVWFFDKVNSTAPELEGGWLDGGDSLVEGWNHVAISYDGGRVRSYINGVETGNYPASGHLPVRNNPVHIGARGGSLGEPASFFKGSIDEVRIWNISRSGDQIRENMNRSLTGDELGLVGYWNFNEGEGQQAADASAYENHARLGYSEEPDDGDPSWIESDYEILVPTPDPPDAPLVWITPPFPKTLDDLSCNAETDFGGEGAVFDHSWFRDGSLLEGEKSPTLSHELTARGQFIECTVSVTFNGVTGPAGRAGVVIRNTTPTAPVVQILPENPAPMDGLAVWIVEESFDADGDDILYIFDWFESDDGINWNRRPELSSNLPFSVGQPEISRLYTQVSEFWRVEVTPVEEHTLLAKGINGHSPVMGTIGLDEVLIQPDLSLADGSEAGMFNASDLLVIRSAWGQTKANLTNRPGLSSLFFEPSDPPEARINSRKLIYLAVQNWYRPIGN